MATGYGPRIRAARAFKGLTQAQLGDRLGLDEQTIKRRESGKQEPKPGERVAIAAICGVPLEFIEHGWPADGDYSSEVESVFEWLKRANDERATQFARILERLTDVETTVATALEQREREMRLEAEAQALEAAAEAAQQRSEPVARTPGTSPAGDARKKRRRTP
jgi:transcriptional regulator with XRE-family HTH domain